MINSDVSIYEEEMKKYIEDLKKYDFMEDDENDDLCSLESEVEEDETST